MLGGGLTTSVNASSDGSADIATFPMHFSVLANSPSFVEFADYVGAASDLSRSVPVTSDTPFDLTA